MNACDRQETPLPFKLNNEASKLLSSKVTLPKLLSLSPVLNEGNDLGRPLIVPRDRFNSCQALTVTVQPLCCLLRKRLGSLPPRGGTSCMFPISGVLYPLGTVGSDSRLRGHQEEKDIVNMV